MIIDVHNHSFDCCPLCRSFVLIIRVPQEEINAHEIGLWRKNANRQQIKMLLAYCDENAIPVTEEERKAA